MKKSVRFAALLCVFVMLCMLLASCDADGEQLTGTVTGIPTLSNYDRFYIKIDGNDGQSYDSQHNRWIDVLDFEFGSESGDLATGKSSSFKDLTFIHLVDRATPRLQSDCMKGSHIATATLHACRAINGKQEVVLAVKMDIVQVVSADVSVLDDGRVIETVKLSCEKMTWTVTQVNIDNSLGGNVEDSYTIRKY